METLVLDEFHIQAQDELENNVILVDEVDYPTPNEFELEQTPVILNPIRKIRAAGFIQPDTSSEIQLVEDFDDFVVASLRRY